VTAELPWRPVAGGVEIAFRLTPRAGADRIEGIVLRCGRPWLAVRVAAPPVDGAANGALIAFLARVLGVARSQVSLLAGERGREKRLRIDGADPARLAALIPSRD